MSGVSHDFVSDVIMIAVLKAAYLTTQTYICTNSTLFPPKMEAEMPIHP
jgi:hypothetical protein